MSEPAFGRQLRVGIVGCGGIARSHVAAYTANPRVDVVGVADIEPVRAEDFGRAHEVTAFASTRDLLDQHLDLVSVSTPPGSHTSVAVDVLASGSSVLVEKPPTTTLADLDVIAAAEQASAGSAYVVFQHRHGSGARRARRLLSTGALGTPRVAVCETLWYRPDSYFLPDWRGNWDGEGGGPTLGHGIHQIDLLLHLLGPWASVQAHSARIARPVEFEDVSMALVTFGSGAVASIVTSLLSPRETSRIRIDTTAGTLEVNHLYGYRDADWSWTAAPDATVAGRLGQDPGARSDNGAEEPTDESDVWTGSASADLPSGHAAQIDRLVDDLIAGRPHDTTLASTRSTIELVTAVYASSLDGAVVGRGDLTPDSAYYHRLDGGRPADLITARLTPQIA